MYGQALLFEEARFPHTGEAPEQKQRTVSRPPAPELESIRRAHSKTCYITLRYRVAFIELLRKPFEELSPRMISRQDPGLSYYPDEVQTTRKARRSRLQKAREPRSGEGTTGGRRKGGFDFLTRPSPLCPILSLYTCYVRRDSRPSAFVNPRFHSPNLRARSRISLSTSGQSNEHLRTRP